MECKMSEKKIFKKQYEKKLQELQIELVRLQDWVIDKGKKVAIVFEGLDKSIQIKAEEIRGPKVDAPEQALEGFIRSNKIERKDLYKKKTEKGEFYFYKVKSKSLKNVRIFDQDIRNLLINITKPYFDDVVIICPDPWQKARHHKRRLINNDFLELLANTIKRDGELFISTDWDNYAESINETLEQNARFSLNKNSKYNKEFLTKFQKRAITENRKISNFFFKKLSRKD